MNVLPRRLKAERILRMVVQETGDDVELMTLVWEDIGRWIAARKQRTSETIRYVPYRDGHLQLEYRFTKKGTRRGPYWLFRYHEGGKQKKLYLGKCDLEEAKRRADDKRRQ